MPPISQIEELGTSGSGTEGFLESSDNPCYYHKAGERGQVGPELGYSSGVGELWSNSRYFGRKD